MQAAARVCKCWSLIEPGSHTPLLCFPQTFLTRKSSYLTDGHILDALQTVELRMHPEQSYLVYQHTTTIMSHSLRFFTCFCLRLMGLDDDAIVHHLRWKSAAVKMYIHQDMFQADVIGVTLF